jgi:hypothetical protein
LATLGSGFVLGNLSGSTLIYVRTTGLWDGLIMMLSIVAIESLHYVGICHGQQRGARTVNAFKLGLTFGFFTDAFKVGS